MVFRHRAPLAGGPERSGTVLAPASVQLSDRDFGLLRELIYEHSGISLNDSKRELVRSRLGKRLRTLGISSFREYRELLVSEVGGDELIHCLDAISTNKTDFFREASHFEFLEHTVLPDLIARRERERRRKLRIWSAGCSTGEEPHTLAIVLQRFMTALAGWDVRIFATDLSTKVLARAQAGRYTAAQVKPVPAQERQRHFDKTGTGPDALFVVKPHLREWIVFRRFNLMTPRFPFRGLFDLIFCRNVMIYFDRPTQEVLVGKFHDLTTPGGHLFIGHSETLNGLTSPWTYLQPTIYRRAP